MFITRFLHCLHQYFPQVVHKEEAFKRIEENDFQNRTKNKMRELVKKNEQLQFVHSRSSENGNQ